MAGVNLHKIQAGIKRATSLKQLRPINSQLRPLVKGEINVSPRQAEFAARLQDALLRKMIELRSAPAAPVTPPPAMPEDGKVSAHQKKSESLRLTILEDSHDTKEVSMVLKTLSDKSVLISDTDRMQKAVEGRLSDPEFSEQAKLVLSQRFGITIEEKIIDPDKSEDTIIDNLKLHTDIQQALQLHPTEQATELATALYLLIEGNRTDIPDLYEKEARDLADKTDDLGEKAKIYENLAAFYALAQGM